MGSEWWLVSGGGCHGATGGHIITSVLNCEVYSVD